MRSKSKILLIVGLTLCLMFSMVGMSLADLSDLQGHWAADQINSWVDKGLASGYQDGTFKPDNNITRAEFITLVNRAYKFTATIGTNYSDVASNAWYAPEIARAKAAGYISGYEDGTIRPDQPISRQETAAIIARICKLDASASLAAVNKFKDAAEIPGWSQGPIGAVVAQGYMNGYPDQTYRPEKLITRAEAIVTLDNTIRTAVPIGTTTPGGGAGTNQAITISEVELTNTFGAFKFSTDVVTTAENILAKVKINGAALKSVEKRNQGTDGTAWKAFVADPQRNKDYKITCEAPFAITGTSTIKWLGILAAPTVTNVIAEDVGDIAPAAPTYVSSAVTSEGDVSITFSKDMADPSGKQAQFSVKVDGVDNVVTAVQLTKTATKIKLVLTDKVTSGQVVTVAYAKGADAASQVIAADGGVLETFVAQDASNKSTVIGS